MPTINAICECDKFWSDVLGYPGEIYRLTEDVAPPINMALLPGGMMSGQPSVCIRINLPDGKIVITETSLALLTQALSVFHAYLEGKAERG